MNTNGDALYEENVKALQAQAMAQLQKELAEVEAKPDPLRAERRMLLSMLFRARERQKLSQTELAKRLGMQQSAISRIEGGRGNPNLNTLLVIAKALDVNLVLEYKH